MKNNILCRKIFWLENENEIHKNDWKLRFLAADVSALIRNIGSSSSGVTG